MDRFSPTSLNAAGKVHRAGDHPDPRSAAAAELRKGRNQGAAPDAGAATVTVSHIVSYVVAGRRVLFSQTGHGVVSLEFGALKKQANSPGVTTLWRFRPQNMGLNAKIS